MSLHQVKLLMRYLRTNRSITFINIIGLIIAFTIVIPIGLYVQHEISYDKGFENRDQIARLVLEGTIGADQYIIAPIGSAPMGATMGLEIEEIEDFVRIDAWGGERPITYEDITYLEPNVLWVDSSFFNVFSYPFVLGDPKTALTTKNTTVITEKTAKKFFGDENPMGKTLMLSQDSRFVYTITGVIKDVDSPTHLPDFPMLCSWVTRHEGIDEENWINNVNWLTYFKLKEGVKYDQLNEKIGAVFEYHAGEIIRQIGGKMTAYLQPLDDIYLGSSKFSFYDWPSGSKNNVIQFMAIGVFVLIIATFNFINLTTARSMNRGRQVGISKVLGATRGQLVRQYLNEAVVVALIAAVIALILAFLLIHQFEMLLDVDLSFNPITDWNVTLLFMLSAVVIGLLAGTYPAFFITSYNPVSVMRGQLRTGVRGRRIRAAFVVLQFTISIVLILSTMLIMRQLNYMRHKDLGFNQEQIVAFRLPNWGLMQQHDAFQTEVLRLAGVTETADADQLPNDTVNNSIYHIPNKPPDSQIYIAGQRIGYDYIKMLDIELLEGRNFDPNIPSDSMGAVIVNEALMKTLNWDSIEGHYIEEIEELDPPKFNEKPIIGLIRDFHFASLYEEVRPMMFEVYKGEPPYIFFKLAPGQIKETMGEIEKIWNDFAPGVPIDYVFLDDLFHDAYQKEEHLGRLFHFFTWLAIFVACLGLFALASFSAEQRTREIGVRKVIGASVPSLINLMVWEFLKLILIANVIAWPLAALVVNKWLENFAYKASFGWWLFPVAGLGAVLVAILTVSSQAYKTAQVNPVESLKVE